MRYIEMNDRLVDYIAAHANPRADPVGERLAATTRERFGDLSGMNIGPDQGRLLETLVVVSGARAVVGVGRVTGMSALWLARGLPVDGRLICLDITDDYADTARAAWEAAGVADRIDLRVGPAADSLAAMPEEPHIDLAFVDADKGGYVTYLELLLPRLTGRGMIVADNVLWGGAVVDDDDQSTNIQAIRAFNDHVAERDDVEAVMLPVGDGITLIRRRSAEG